MNKKAKEQLEAIIRSTLPEIEELSVLDELPSALRGDLVARANVQGKTVLIAAMLSRKASGERLQGTLARLWLELDAYDDAAEIILPIVVDEDIGENVIQRIDEFAARCMPSASFGVIGTKNRILSIQGLRFESEIAGEAIGTQTQRKKRSRLFTDVDRWILKIFLIHRLRQSIVEEGPPRSTWPPKDARALSYFAAVAYETARSFCEAYAERGFLIRNPAPIRLLNVQALLTSWLEDERGWTQEQVFARSLDGSEPDLKRLNSSEFDLVIGGFQAVRAHGLKHASNPSPLLLHIDVPPAKAIRTLDFVKCDEGNAQVILRRPAHPISVFKAAEMSSDGYRIVDPWQAALDLVQMRQRGAEQATFILKNLVAELTP